MRGWSARRRVTALVIFTGSAYTLLALTVPWARTALVNPAARVAIETGVVAAMCGAALLMTLLERQRRPSGRDAFIAALVVQAGVNVAFGIIPALLGDQPGLDRTFYPWLAGRYVAGFLLLAAALRTRPAPAGVTVVASLLAVVAVEVAISVVDPSVPVSGVDPRAVTPLGLAWLLEAGPLVMFAAGAVAAGRYAEQSGEPLEFWLSLALAVGAFTQVHQAAFPAALGATITSSDLLRAASAVLLLGGVVRQVVQLKVQRDQAVRLLQRDLESSRRALQEAREAREREAAFMSVVGHELASPIAVINAQTHLLQVTGPEEVRPHVEAIGVEADRLGGLVRRMDELRSIDDAAFEVHLRPVAIAPLLAEVAQFGQGLPGTHTWHVDADPERVRADPVRLGQVLRNLVANANRYSPPDSTVAITGRMQADGYHVLITDEGPGVGAEDVDALFQPFVRGTTTTASGTGLGLHVVRRIVEAHHGRVEFVDPAEPGTRVRVVLVPA